MPDEDTTPLTPEQRHDPQRALFDLGVRSSTQPTFPRDWQPPSVEELQRHLPQYEIIAFVARGGMGAVYKGAQKSLDRHVAIKILPHSLNHHDPQYAERFKREARAMAKLRHPGIVAVYDAGETSEGLFYYVMEFIEGSDVARLVAAEGRLPPELALTIVARVCDALAYAHDRGVVHRDIKPSNIMIEPDGTVKVADFGLAKLVLEHGGLSSGLAVGTPDFISPEALITGVVLDGRADLYAVGVMLYQMLTGQIPRGRFQLPSRVVPQLDPRLDAIVDKAMQTDREKRYSSAVEIKEAVEVVAKRAAQRVSPRSRAAWIVGCSAAAALTLGAFFFHGGKHSAELSVKPTPVISTEPHTPAPEPSPSPKPEQKSAPPPNLPPEPGSIKLWDSANQLPKTPGIRWEDNAVRLDGNSLDGTSHTSRDGSLRALIRMDSRMVAAQLALRNSGAQGHENRYRATLTSENIVLAAVQSGKATELGQWKLPRHYGAEEWLQLELRAVDHLIGVKVDGKELGSVSDDSVPDAGYPSLYASFEGCFRDIFYLPLDKPETEPAGVLHPSPEPQGEPVNDTSLREAKKDAPFINSLGLRFVPVVFPGLLFSTWDTRVKDFAAFVKETRYDAVGENENGDAPYTLERVGINNRLEWKQAGGSWKDPHFPSGTEQKPDNPVVCVSYADAEAFCAWLTQKEHALGRLPAAWSYRVPGDLEWNYAMAGGKYPWGDQWPPGAEDGNYAGTEAMIGDSLGVPNELAKIGFQDPFARSSPVGSFKTNRYGLYDMGGNVWQWCSTWYHTSLNFQSTLDAIPPLKDDGGGEKYRVVRGASWDSGQPLMLQSLYVFNVVPKLRTSNLGFRCVLSDHPSDTRLSFEPPARPAKKRSAS